MLEVLATETREEKETKRVHIGEEEAKLPLSTDGVTLHTESPKLPTRKLLELNDDSGKAAGCETNAQKCLACLYTDNEDLKDKLRKQPHLPSQQREQNT